jgi:hypothetical protein
MTKKVLLILAILAVIVGLGGIRKYADYQRKQYPDLAAKEDAITSALARHPKPTAPSPSK